MAVFNFESGNPLLLLREIHLPSWTNSRATFLPQIRDLPVSTGFAGCDFVKFSQNPSRKPISTTNFPLILAHLGLFWPFPMKWNEMQNAKITLFHDPNSKLAVIAVTLPFSNNWWHMEGNLHTPNVATCQAQENFHEEHLAVYRNILLAHVGIYMAAFRRTWTETSRHLRSCNIV